MDDRKLSIRYTEGAKRIIENYEIRGADPYAANEAEKRLAPFIGKFNRDSEDPTVHELGAHLYDTDANMDLGVVVAFVDHQDEGLVEIDTDIAPYFVKTK